MKTQMVSPTPPMTAPSNASTGRASHVGGGTVGPVHAKNGPSSGSAGSSVSPTPVTHTPIKTFSTANTSTHTQPQLPGQGSATSTHQGLGIDPDASAVFSTTATRLDSAGNPISEISEISEDDIDAAVERINDFLQSVTRNLYFTYDDELERPVIKVFDADNEKLIRQLPPEEFLSVLAHLEEVRGLLFADKA